MSNRERIVIGGIGAMTPVLLQLVALDINTMSDNLSGVAVAAYLVKVLLLFSLGGFWAYIHSDVKNKKLIFQLGIVAPSIITGLIASSQVDVNIPDSQELEVVTVGSLWVAPAYAGGEKKFEMPQQSTADQILTGLIGKRVQNNHYVIVGTHKKEEDAKEQAGKINSLNKGLKADVFTPSPGLKGYSVVVGEQKTLPKARKIKSRAERLGYDAWIIRVRR